MKITPALVAVPFITTCGAAVIRNDAMMVTPSTPPHFFPFAHTFFVSSAPFLVVEVITGESDDFTFQYRGIAEAYSLFRVTSGVDFNAAFVNSQPSLVNNWNNPGTGVLYLSPGQSEYIGYWDQGSGPPGLTAGDSDIFGWALVTNSDGALIVSDSATADSGGIKIGTLQQIPEAGTISICAAGIALCCVWRRRIATVTARR